MSDIGPIGSNPVNRIIDYTADRVEQKSPSAEESIRRDSDSIDLSERARLTGLLQELPDVRHNLINRIRAEIEAGTYDTNEKLDIAIDRLLPDLI